MTQGGFYDRKRMNPGAVAVVVLLHGAAITAVAMAREGVFQHAKPPPIVVRQIPLEKDPPPKPEPVRERRQTPEIETHTPPVVELPIPDPFTQPPAPHDPPQPESLPGPKVAELPPAPLPPAPTPPPPRLEVKVQPARAKANLGSYVSDADYPTDAIRREEQGATRFRLAVGPDGRVTGCTVTGSSGSAALDTATCRLMKSRARFAPARDTGGNATADAVSSTIVWRIPAG